MNFRKVVPLLTICSVLVVVGGARVASAQPFADLVCAGGGLGRLDPGATLTASPQHLTAEIRAGTAASPLTPCSSVTGVPYTGATFVLDGTGNLGCLSGKVSGTAVVTWDNGEVSTANWSLNLPLFVLPIFDFRFIAGPLAGARASLLGAPTGFGGNCVSHPLTRLGGVGVGLILRV